MMAPSGGKQKIETQGWNLHTVVDTSVGCHWLFSIQLVETKEPGGQHDIIQYFRGLKSKPFGRGGGGVSFGFP